MTMGRWLPDGRSRLAIAALDLFAEQGYEQTTVNQIAERAGLTQRTFFRHFADKREVLFAGGDFLKETILGAAVAAPAAASPVEAITAGLVAGSAVLDNRDFSRQRQAVITANAELRERELIKLAGIAASLASALRERGVSEPSATLTAEVGMTVFRVAFESWVAPARTTRTLEELIRETLAQLPAVTAPPAKKPRARAASAAH